MSEENGGKDLPKLVVFDLDTISLRMVRSEKRPVCDKRRLQTCRLADKRDFTLWPFWADTHVTAPFSRKSNGSVEDRHGYKIKLYDDTLEILRLLKSQGICLAAASRTEDPPAAKELLKVLNIDWYFSYKEIYPGSKVTHFKKFTQASGVSYSNMLFFDDEERNIHEISRLGVTCVLVRRGMNLAALQSGLKEYAEKQRR